MQPTRLKRNFHPSGDLHWTRQPGVVREPWGKLPPAKRAELIERVKAGERADDLAREYRIGRTTAWRYLRREGLVKTRLVSGVSHSPP